MKREEQRDSESRGNARGIVPCHLFVIPEDRI